MIPSSVEQLIAPLALLHFPLHSPALEVGCGCGETFCTEGDWAAHVAHAVSDALNLTQVGWQWLDPGYGPDGGLMDMDAIKGGDSRMHPVYLVGGLEVARNERGTE